MRRNLIITLLVISASYLLYESAMAVEILSKSKLEKCEKVSVDDKLNCSRKIVLNMAVPSGTSGGEASIVVELVEAEENTTHEMHAMRNAPVITVNKSAAYALYEITYIRDVPYKPVEYFVRTRKCEPDASAKVVKVCERLRDGNGNFIESTRPICCPCGPWHRAPTSCGNFFDKVTKGKSNTAHCVRFPGDWFHVFGIGRRSLGFNIHVQVKKGSKKSEVVVGPENRTVLSKDNFLRVNLIGDFVGYTNIPSFEDLYLVIPRQGPIGHPVNLGSNFSMWMLLERVRFTLDGLECNKIGVSYDAFRAQPSFCSSPLQSCLHNQLWHFWDADQARISRNQSPQYVIERRFERINQHPNAGSHTFSIGITEALNTNLLIEIGADDIEYLYQRSLGKILSITVPTFEALTQYGSATITAKNIGALEASYSLTFDCSKGVSHMEEQFFVLKPQEITSRSFKVYPTTDQAAKYKCSAILKDSNFNEIDRANCQFMTTAMITDNGTQIAFDVGSNKQEINDFLNAVKGILRTMWSSFADFFTGKSCRNKCPGFFDFSCHMQYICLSWIALLGLFLAMFPTVIALVWLLHQKGFFDPFCDWWLDQFEVYQKRSIVKKGRSAADCCHAHCHYMDNPYARHYGKERKKQHRENSLVTYNYRRPHHHHGHRRHRYESDNVSDGTRRGCSMRRKDRAHKRARKDSFTIERVGQSRHKLGKRIIKGTPKDPRDYGDMEAWIRKHRHGRRKGHADCNWHYADDAWI